MMVFVLYVYEQPRRLLRSRREFNMKLRLGFLRTNRLQQPDDKRQCGNVVAAARLQVDGSMRT